jgi:hypothetical protein
MYEIPFVSNRPSVVRDDYENGPCLLAEAYYPTPVLENQSDNSDENRPVSSDNPAIWKTLSELLHSVLVVPISRELVLAAVAIDVRSLECFDKSFRSDREVMLAALRRNYDGAKKYVDPSLFSDEEFVSSAQEIWYDTQDLYFSSIPNSNHKKQRIIAELESSGISWANFGNARLSEIQEIIDNRRDLKPDGRPLAVVVYPKPETDYNGALRDRNLAIDLIRRGYRVVYFEAGKDTGLFNAIRVAGRYEKIPLLVIGGHGTRLSTQFGADYKLGEARILDISDLREMGGLRRYLGKNSTIVLNSCSTGEGEERAANIANLLAIIFPNSTVFAPTKPSSSELIFDHDRVVGVQYYGATTYSIHAHDLPATTREEIRVFPNTRSKSYEFRNLTIWRGR